MKTSKERKMKYINKTLSLILLAGMCLFTACDEEPTEALEGIIKEDLGYLPVIAAFKLVSPSGSVVQPGMQTSFDLRFWSEGNIEEIQYWMIEGDNEALIGEQAYTPAYSMVSRTDSTLFNFTVPISLESGDTIAVQARVFNEGLEEYPAVSSITLTVPE
jgi:hypothetical protein